MVKTILKDQDGLVWTMENLFQRLQFVERALRMATKKGVQIEGAAFANEWLSDLPQDWKPEMVGLDEIKNALKCAINAIPQIKDHGQYYEDGIIAGLKQALAKIEEPNPCTPAQIERANGNTWAK